MKLDKVTMLFLMQAAVLASTLAAQDSKDQWHCHQCHLSLFVISSRCWILKFCLVYRMGFFYICLFLHSKLQESIAAASDPYFETCKINIMSSHPVPNGPVLTLVRLACSVWYFLVIWYKILCQHTNSHTKR